MNLGLRLSLTTALSSGGGAPPAPSITPNVMTASSFWTPASKKTGQDTGLNGSPAPTASPTLRGSGYEETCVLQHSSRYMPCFESDADTLSDYIMIWITGDPAKMGSRQIEVTFEGTVATFNIPEDGQWDPVKMRYGVPIALRPRTGYSGVGRCYVKGLPQNGYERVMSFDVWFNYPGTTNYFDRAANAIYVSGADLAGSGAIGTNDATVGTSGNPNYRLNRATQFATDPTYGKEGCYIYIKGHVIDDTAGGSTPTTNVLPCSVRPWPGYTRAQTKIGCSSRAITEYLPNIRLIQYYNIQVDSDNIVNIRGASNGTTRGGFLNCIFLGNPNGGLDARDLPKGLFAGVSTNSQQWVRANSGEEWSLEDCSGSMYCSAGFRIISNVDIVNGWDSIFIDQNAYSTRGWSYWGYRTSGPDYAYARFHLEEDLEVVSSSYDAVNRWTKVLVENTAGFQLIQNNSNETAVRFLDGPQQGDEIWPGLGINPANYVGTGAQYPDDACCIIGSNPAAVAAITNYPDANTVYVKGADRTTEFPTGRLIRVYNFPHKDAFQTTMQSSVNPWPENGYIQNYKNVSIDPQGMLLQASAVAVTGTCSVTGNTVTFTNAQTLKAGMSFQIRSGANIYKYGIIAADTTASLTATLDRTDLDATIAGTTFALGRPLKDFVFENYLVHRTIDFNFLFQWEAVGINLHFLNATILDTAPNGLHVVIKNKTAGFGAKDASFRDCIIGQVRYDSGAPYRPDVLFSGNHFMDASPEVIDATQTVGAPTFDSEGTGASNYYPTGVSVGTVASAFVPFDLNGNVRAIGNKRGAVVA